MYIILFLVKIFDAEDTDKKDELRLVKIHDVLSCLATNGKWVTSQLDLQVYTLILRMKVLWSFGLNTLKLASYHNA